MKWPPPYCDGGKVYKGHSHVDEGTSSLSLCNSNMSLATSEYVLESPPIMVCSNVCTTGHNGLFEAYKMPSLTGFILV